MPLHKDSFHRDIFTRSYRTRCRPRVPGVPGLRGLSWGFSRPNGAPKGGAPAKVPRGGAWISLTCLTFLPRPTSTESTPSTCQLDGGAYGGTMLLEYTVTPGSKVLWR